MNIIGQSYMFRVVGMKIRGEDWRERDSREGMKYIPVRVFADTDAMARFSIVNQNVPPLVHSPIVIN